MSGPTTQCFDCPDLPHPRGVPQLVLLSPATAPATAIAAAPADASHPASAGSVPAQLWLSTHSCAAPAAGYPLQPQDRLSPPQKTSLAGLPSAPHPTSRPPARGQGGGAPIQPALGLRHHHVQALVRPQAPLGCHYRLRRPHGHRLEITGPADRPGDRRTPPRSSLPALWTPASIRQRAGVPHRQRPRVHRRAAPAVAGTVGPDHLPHSLPQSPIQRSGRVILRQSQKRLPCTSTFGYFARGFETHPHMDYPLQRSR